MIYLSIILCTINRLIPSTSSSELAGCTENNFFQFLEGSDSSSKESLRNTREDGCKIGSSFQEIKKKFKLCS